MEEGLSKNRITFFVVIFLVGVALVLAVYFGVKLASNNSTQVNNPEQNSIELSSLEEQCGELLPEERGACCADLHKDELIIRCEGAWTFLEGSNSCQYVCTGQPLACNDDEWICEDGTTVERNPENNCEFYSCQD